MTLSNDHLKHLEFIQATISRQASHSFAVKGWSLTVAGLIYAYTTSHLTCWLAVVALLPPVTFAWLDLFYLRQERLFRELYKDVINPHSTAPVFDMDTRRYQEQGGPHGCTYRSVMTSSTWWVLHAMIAAVGLVLLGVALFQ